MSSPSIVIATPHQRNDSLVNQVSLRLPDCQVTRVRNHDSLAITLLDDIKPDFVFFPHWSWIIPPEIYTRFTCIIFHMTDLPYGRGGSPLQNLIVRGHKETLLTALLCVSELDAGPVYLKRPLSLAGTAEEILQRASSLIAEMIVDIVRECPAPTPQQGKPVLFKRRTANQGNLAPLTDLGMVYDYIRMLDGEGYPPAFIDTEHLHLEFSEAVLGETEIKATVRIIRKAT